MLAMSGSIDIVFSCSFVNYATEVSTEGEGHFYLPIASFFRSFSLFFVSCAMKLNSFHANNNNPLKYNSLGFLNIKLLKNCYDKTIT